MPKSNYLELDAIDMASDFEDWLEKEFPYLSLADRAEAGRRLISFIEYKQDLNSD